MPLIINSIFIIFIVEIKELAGNHSFILQIVVEIEKQKTWSQLYCELDDDNSNFKLHDQSGNITTMTNLC